MKPIARPWPVAHLRTPRMGRLIAGLVLGLLLAGNSAARAEAPRRRALPPLHPPTRITLRSRPLAVRLDIPPALRRSLAAGDVAGEGASYRLRFEGITLRTDQATLVRVFAGRSATAWTSPERRDFIDYFAIAASTRAPAEEMQRADLALPLSGADLRRFLGGRGHLPLTLVQVDSSGQGPRRGVTVRIERIHLVAAEGLREGQGRMGPSR